MTSHGTQASIWDAANRLSSHGGLIYAYNGLNNRISQTVNSVVTEYLLDVQPGLTKVIGATTSGNTERYIHSPRGVHAMEDSSGNWLHPAPDGLGSIRMQLDDNLNVDAMRNFGLYGDPSGVQGTFDMPFGFTGEMTDSNDLLYLRARYYNPETGTFTALDPWEGSHDRAMSLNGYSWVEGNTPNMVDPSGHCTIPVGACVASVLNVFDNAAVIGFGVDFVACSWATACVGGGLALYYTVLDTFGADVANLLAEALSIDVGSTTVPGNAQPPDVGDVIDDIADEVRRKLADICNAGWCESGLNWVFRFIKGDTIERILRGIRDLVRDRAGTNDETYYFRGTTVGWPGSPALQQVGVTPTSTQPGVATVFATVAETEYGGEGIVYIASSSELAGVGISPNNVLASFEFEVAFDILPSDFAELAGESVSAAKAREILATMGVVLDSRIWLSDQSALLRGLSPLSKPQIRQFVEQAKVTL